MVNRCRAKGDITHDVWVIAPLIYCNADIHSNFLAKVTTLFTSEDSELSIYFKCYYCWQIMNKYFTVVDFSVFSQTFRRITLHYHCFAWKNWTVPPNSLYESWSKKTSTYTQLLQSVSALHSIPDLDSRTQLDCVVASNWFRKPGNILVGASQRSAEPTGLA